MFVVKFSRVKMLTLSLMYWAPPGVWNQFPAREMGLGCQKQSFLLMFSIVHLRLHAHFKILPQPIKITKPNPCPNRPFLKKYAVYWIVGVFYFHYLPLFPFNVRPPQFCCFNSCAMGPQRCVSVANCATVLSRWITLAPLYKSVAKTYICQDKLQTWTQNSLETSQIL